ncbi:MULTISPECIES: ABC transporter substrate-binding protein [unclassified Roseovarius]|uniref:ABC transporter substrate-binding protein n=1 Tax=unclassified Roseovarius TaxID=2614913 RepID=UPI00273D993E|nr:MULTISPECIES: ABC transporter substrate-binding protein [unclassified Roseovarius]
MKNDDSNLILDRIVAAGRQRGITRRHFMQNATATGLTAAAAATLWTNEVSAMTPSQGGNFRVAIHDANTTDTMDPGQYLSVFMIQLAHASRSYLTEVNPDGTLGPDLADSWTASPDAKVWTFELNKNATFHDGRPVTSNDVLASLRHHLGEESASAAKSLLANVTDVRADGDHTVVIELDTGLADLPYIMTDYHIAMVPADADGKADWAGGMGSGPYKVDNFNAGVSAKLTKHEGWHRDGGYFDSIELIAINDPNARQTALVSGDVDAVSSVDLKTLALLERRAGISILNLPSGSAVTLPMHVTQAPFDNNDVRMALKLAINRDELIEKIVFGTATPGNDFHISPNMPYYPDDIPQRTHDPDKAKWHLKQAGMDSLSLDMSASDSIMPGAVDFVTLFSEQAKAANINIKPIREPGDGYWADVWLKKPFIFSKWGARPTPDTMFTLAYKTGASWSEAFWSNERFDELLLQAKAELDDTKRAEMYREMSLIARDDGGTILPMFTNYVYAHQDTVAHPENVGSTWELDGARAYQRWWFKG